MKAWNAETSHQTECPFFFFSTNVLLKKKWLYLQTQHIYNWKENLIFQNGSAATLTYFTFITRHPFTHDFTCVPRLSFQMGAIFFFFGHHSNSEDNLTRLPGFSRSSREMEDKEEATCEANYSSFPCFLSLSSNQWGWNENLSGICVTVAKRACLPALAHIRIFIFFILHFPSPHLRLYKDFRIAVFCFCGATKEFYVELLHGF